MVQPCQGHFCHYYIVWESNNHDNAGDARGQSWNESLKSRCIPGGLCGLYEWYKAKAFCCAFFAVAMMTMVAAATIVRFPSVSCEVTMHCSIATGHVPCILFWPRYIESPMYLTHWSRVKHMRGMNYAFLGSDNDLSPVRSPVTAWTKAELLSIPYRSYLNGIFIFIIHLRNWFWNWYPGNISRIISAMRSIMYFWGQSSEWYPFGPCRITYKMMLNPKHCYHIVGPEISSKVLMLLSQIPPECARSYGMPFHTSRSSLSCNIWKQTNTKTMLSLKQTNKHLIYWAWLLYWLRSQWQT